MDEQFDINNPGLFNLGLNVSAKSNAELEDLYLYLCETLKDPTPAVYNILHCFIAFIENKSPLSKRKALDRLEAILTDHPKHLNALANIENIFRQMNMNVHADIYNIRKNEILKGNDSKFTRQKAICFLEQGYCILAEDVDNYEEAPKYHTAIEYLEHGLKMLESCDDSNRTECTIWKYYIAQAHMRYERRMKFDFRKCMSYFIEVIQYLESSDNEMCNFYIARSYCYIGSIVMNDSFDTNLFTSEVFSRDFQEILQNPLKAYERANLKRPVDRVVLNRYARCLSKNVKLAKNPEDKKKHFVLAESLLEKSIENSPESNWGAYTTRIELCVHLTRSNNNVFNDEKTKSILLRALEDARKCSETKISGKDCALTAEICHRLARFPYQTFLLGDGFVKEEKYLYEALAFLHLGRNHDRQMNFYNNFNMGRCLSDLREYRTAVEWTKRAVYSSKIDKLSKSLELVCSYLSLLYSGENEEAGQEYIFEELFIFMVYGSPVSSEHDEIVERMTKFMLKFWKEQLLSVVAYFNKSQYRHDPLYLDIMQKIHPRGFVANTTVISQKDNLDEPFTNNNPTLPKNKHFDDSEETYHFFIFSSCKDSGWIITHLLRQLEQSFDENEKRLRGCIERRDFEIGKPVIDNVVNAITKSSHILVILSPAFLEHRFNQLQCNSRIKESVEQKQKVDGEAVILVMIQKCTIPESVKHLQCIDLTEHTNMLQEILKLKSILLKE